MDIQDFISTLEEEFQNNGNPQTALEQKAYMRNQFEYFGLKTQDRRKIQKPFLQKEYLPNKTDLIPLLQQLWKQPQREFQYFAQELLQKYLKNMEEQDLKIMEYMVINKSWWDTVDAIATKPMGVYFQSFPEKRISITDRWIESQNIWLQRCSLIFQLKYKKELDNELLSSCIKRLLGTKEFFINKAIGWILREYSRTNPQWVQDFAAKTNLSPLSRREALRLL